ncbi:MAG: APC family permease [Firmicutes bacterium]|nr:APC family permease [Bacillota bacterium]
MKVKYEGGQVLTDVMPDLKKTKFSLLGVVFFIYCACSGGAFGVESIIPTSGPGMTLLLLVVIPLMWALPMGLYVSELTNLAPVDSGPYVWVKMAFGEFWGYAFGLWMAVAWYLTGASYIVLATDYIGMYIAMTPTVAFIVKAVIILVFTVVNLLGVQEANILNTIFTVIIVVAFMAVAIVGIINWENNPFDPFMNTEAGAMSSLGVGIAVGVWMFCGFTAIANLGGEIENPQIIPKGMKLCIVLIGLCYILPTIGGIVSVGPWYEWGTTIDYSTVLFTHVGKWAGMAFMVVAVISQLALLNATTATASRSFMVLGKDHLCPKFLSSVSKNRKVPVWPIVILAALNLVLVNLDFEILVIILSPLLFICYAGFAVAFLKLRKLYPVEKRGDLYYVKGKISPYYIVIAMLIIGIVGLLLNGTEYFLLGYVLILFALIMYIFCKKVYGGLAVENPLLYPVNEKTGLAKGDIVRFGYFFLIFGAIAFLGSFFLRWYEADWGPEYYLDLYGSGLISNWSLMITVATWVGAIMLVLCVICFLVGKKIDPIPDDDE